MCSTHWEEFADGEAINQGFSYLELKGSVCLSMPVCVCVCVPGRKAIPSSSAVERGSQFLISPNKDLLV